MHAVVDDVAAGIVPEPVPGVVEMVLVERTRGRRAEPHVVIDPGGHRLVGQVADGRPRLAVEDLDEVDLAQLARLQVLQGRRDVGSTPALGADLDDPAVLPSRLDHLAAFPDAVAGGLLDVNVLAGLAGPDRAQGMPVVGGRDHQRVDALVIEDAPDVADRLGTLPAQRLDLGWLAPGAAACRRPPGRRSRHRAAWRST